MSRCTYRCASAVRISHEAERRISLRFAWQLPGVWNKVWITAIKKEAIRDGEHRTSCELGLQSGIARAPVKPWGVSANARTSIATADRLHSHREYLCNATLSSQDVSSSPEFRLRSSRDLFCCSAGIFIASDCAQLHVTETRGKHSFKLDQ